MVFDIVMYENGVLPDAWAEVPEELRAGAFDWSHRGMKFRVGVSLEDRRKAGCLGFKAFFRALEAELDKFILDCLLQVVASPAQRSGAAELPRVISA